MNGPVAPPSCYSRRENRTASTTETMPIATATRDGFYPFVGPSATDATRLVSVNTAGSLARTSWGPRVLSRLLAAS